MSFTEAHQRWIGGAANSPMFVGSAQAVPEPETTADTITRLEASEKYLMDQNIQQRVPIDSQASVGLLLEAILDELKQLTAWASAGESRSSATVKTSTRGVDLDVKSYADGLLNDAITDAIHGYARGMRELAELQSRQWVETAEALRA